MEVEWNESGGQKIKGNQFIYLEGSYQEVGRSCKINIFLKNGM